jgi:C4-dicarboxylate-specific signal transduction histidine kinase
MMNFDAISRAGAAGRIALTEYTTNINIHAPLEPMNATAQLQGDRIQLQQVLLNLVRNGIEAMSTISDRPRVLRIRSEPTENGEALVAVEDTGVGLDPASADRIFDPLFTTKLDGMGMGLSICRSIVEAIAGDYGRRRP